MVKEDGLLCQTLELFLRPRNSRVILLYGSKPGERHQLSLADSDPRLLQLHPDGGEDEEGDSHEHPRDLAGEDKAVPHQIPDIEGQRGSEE